MDIKVMIDAAAEDFAAVIDGLSGGAYVCEGVLKQAVTSAIWALYRKMPDARSALAEILDDWPPIIREATEADEKRESEE